MLFAFHRYVSGFLHHSLYGTEKTFSQIGLFSFQNKSEIKNLFLCGASTLSHGVGGATYSGVAAAAKVLECSPQELLIPDENQHVRIYDAEDSATWPAWVHEKRKVRKHRLKSSLLDPSAENRNHRLLYQSKSRCTHFCQAIRIRICKHY